MKHSDRFDELVTIICNAERAQKASRVTAVNRKAEKVYSDADMAKKADKTYVDSELSRKADKTYVDARLAGKQDTIPYYLAGATVSDEGYLVITGSDGETVEFAATGAGVIDHVATPDGDLPVVSKRVTIPLANSGTAGEAGSAGLIVGVYEEF